MNYVFSGLAFFFTKKAQPKKKLQTGIVTELIPTSGKIKQIVVHSPEELDSEENHNPLAFRPIIISKTK